MTERAFALATLEIDGAPVPCIEIEGVAYRLAPAMARIGAADWPSLRALFDDWVQAAPLLGRAAAAVRPEDRATFDAVRLAPLLYPGKIFCAGANYYDHLAEMGMPGARKEEQRLFFFAKPPRNAVVGPGRTVRMPLDTCAFDWEIELAAVIGRTARAVPTERALDHVAGYTVAIDFSARDLNRAPETFYKLDWVAGKAHDTCCPMGPAIVPASFIPDPQDLGLKLAVNGAIKQDARSSGMIFSIAEQIATLSRIMTLDPGDVVLTGTPAGVGVPKGTFLKVGDHVSAEIERIGRIEIEIAPPG
jgi:2-keto-4-pentenoate hydratase/2-oxohepta-3-ene-1,7-dioic acid hydratase in catechol pathway